MLQRCAEEKEHKEKEEKTDTHERDNRHRIVRLLRGVSWTKLVNFRTVFFS